MKFLYSLMALFSISVLQAAECNLSQIWTTLLNNPLGSYEKVKSLPQELWAHTMESHIESAATLMLQRQGLIRVPQNVYVSSKTPLIVYNNLYALDSIWDIKMGKMLPYWNTIPNMTIDADKTVELRGEPVTAYCENNNGSIKIVGTYESKVFIYTTRDLQNPWIINIKEKFPQYTDCSIEDIILSPDNSLVAIRAEFEADDDTYLSYLIIVNLKTGLVTSLAEGDIDSVKFNSDSSRLYFVGDNSTLWYYDCKLRTLHTLISLPREEYSNIKRFPRVLPGKKYIAVCERPTVSSSNVQLKIFTQENNELLHTLEFSEDVISIGYTSKETELLITQKDGIFVVNLETGLRKKIPFAPIPGDDFQGAFYSVGNDSILIITTTSEIIAYNIATKTRIFTYKAPHRIKTIALNEYATYLVTIFEDNHSAQIIHLPQFMQIYNWFKNNLTADQFLFLNILEHYYKPHLRTSLHLIAYRLGIPALCLQQIFWSFPTLIHDAPELFYLIANAYDIELHVPSMEKIQQHIAGIESRKRKSVES